MDEGETPAQAAEEKDIKEEKKEEPVEQYQVTGHCKNCHAPQSMRIPKGKTIAEFAKDVECRYCGCKAGYLE